MTRDDWESAAADWLAQLSTASLRRARRVVRALDATHVEIDGQTLVNFSSNDYLGLSHHPAVIAAGVNAIREFGAGAGAAPLVAGQTPLHAEAEARLAAWKRTESAVLLPSGYQANLAAIQTLASVAKQSGKSLRILMDKLCHASLIDAVRSSGLAFRVFPHNGVDKLQRLLAEADAGQIQVVVTESIFSMDGDAAKLKALSLLKLQYSFLLVLDEAHSSGVYGLAGRGLADELALNSLADISIVTLSKALGCGGGAVCGSQPFCDALVNGARAYIYSTATPPVVPAALLAGLSVMENEPELQSRLRESAKRIRDNLSRMRFQIPPGDSPIIAIILGDEDTTLNAAERLRADGHLCVAIRPPTVAPNTSRLRITISARHTDAELDALLTSLRSLRM
jgi:8-amino-7-oxononanoate synthase